jgi:uncharacterized protein YecT (DUF1311 family)
MFSQDLILLLLLSSMPLGAQQTTSPHNPCEEQPPSQRQMNDCAAFEYGQADARLNKVYEGFERNRKSTFDDERIPPKVALGS